MLWAALWMAPPLRPAVLDWSATLPERPSTRAWLWLSCTKQALTRFWGAEAQKGCYNGLQQKL